MNNDYAMGWAAGTVQRASDLANLSGMDMTGAYMGQKGQGSGQVQPPSQWGKEAPVTAPEKPNVWKSILAVAMSEEGMKAIGGFLKKGKAGETDEEKKERLAKLETLQKRKLSLEDAKLAHERAIEIKKLELEKEAKDKAEEAKETKK